MPLRSLVQLLLLSAALLPSPRVLGQDFQLVPTIGGLSAPVEIAHCGDDRLFVVEQVGRIRIFHDGILSATPFLDISSAVIASGERGLLGLAFDPQYQQNGHFFVYYVGGSGNGTTILSRFTVSADPDVADPNSEVVLWSLAQPFTNHNGGCVRFGPDGYLYFAPGDGGDAGDPGDRAQDLTQPFGKMMRIAPQPNGTYTIPPDNPFAASPTALHEIWAYGFRNPWRFAFDPLTDDLWIADVGEDTREEVDVMDPQDNSGPNFGWRCYEGSLPYNTTGCQGASAYVFPLFEQQQALGWCSIIGGMVYRGDQYPSLYGRYIYTDYCLGDLYSYDADGGGGGLLLDSDLPGIVSIGTDQCGTIFIVSSYDGMVYRLIDAGQCGEDVTRDGLVKYAGANNDRDPILAFIGGTVPTNVVPCACCTEDVNGDGLVKYAGANNDRDPILAKIGGTVPTHVVDCNGAQVTGDPTE
ncbi:MAG: PQQ-dependent sugar dehydrogenase [Flavobacteriales bacterium]|nr:PQQ-dependent sugar dehydrogenase [Flavobacteriales bacterium]MCB9194510.1 PQQ-dependent sugar dehydrogenase [Flavobacteriales bacterium]